MPGYEVSPMDSADRPAVAALLDDALGRGFWDPLRDLEGIVLVASAEGRLVGVASASVEADPAVPAVAVGHVRLVAVCPPTRRQGVATRLVSEVSDVCLSTGAKRLIAYAWVHQDLGVAPLAGALERAGYALVGRIENFYSNAVADECPACGQSPCACAADLFVRTASIPDCSFTR